MFEPIWQWRLIQIDVKDNPNDHWLNRMTIFNDRWRTSMTLRMDLKWRSWSPWLIVERFSWFQNLTFSLLDVCLVWADQVQGLDTRRATNEQVQKLPPTISKSESNPGWRFRNIQRWSVFIQRSFWSVSALFITCNSQNNTFSVLNSSVNNAEQRWFLKEPTTEIFSSASFFKHILQIISLTCEKTLTT